MHYCTACLKGLQRRVQSVQNAAAPLVTVITSHRSCGNCTDCRATTSPIQGRCPGLPVSMHWRICQTTGSSSLTSACADSARPTRWCVLVDGHTTPSTIGVSQQLDRHACGTHYLLNYDKVTVSESSNGCWRHTCWRPRRFVTFSEERRLEISLLTYLLTCKLENNTSTVYMLRHQTMTLWTSDAALFFHTHVRLRRCKNYWNRWRFVGVTITDRRALLWLILYSTITVIIIKFSFVCVSSFTVELYALNLTVKGIEMSKRRKCTKSRRELNDEKLATG